MGGARDAEAEATVEKAFNPFEPGFTDDPYPQFAELCATNPVQQTPLGLWALFGYDDAIRILRDPRLSVEDKNVVGVNPRAELREHILGSRQERGTHQILNLDPPDHTRLRGLVQQVFTPRVVEQLAPRVQTLVDEALDAVRARGDDMDVIADLAFPLPFRVISEMLGMPASDQDQLRDWAHTLTLSLEPLLAVQHTEEILAASDHMIEHVLDAIEWSACIRRTTCCRRSLPPRTTATGSPPTSSSTRSSCCMSPGTRRPSTSSATARSRSCATASSSSDGATIPPSMSTRSTNCCATTARSSSRVRVTTSELAVGDRTIEPGVFVLTCLAAANRDAAKWGADAQVLDLGRTGAAQHLAFGSGIHHCLGAALARLEGRIALGTLIRRFPNVELATDQPAWNGRLVLRGLDRLPVTLAAE